MQTESKKTSVSLTVEQHKRLKKLAAKKGIPLSRLVKEACLEMLEDEEDVSYCREALKDESGSCTLEEYLKRREGKQSR